MVFVPASKMCDWLMDRFKSRMKKAKIGGCGRLNNNNELTISAIHDQMCQKERELVCREYRSGVNKVLICTDIMTRGINVKLLIFV